MFFADIDGGSRLVPQIKAKINLVSPRGPVRQDTRCVTNQAGSFLLLFTLFLPFKKKADLEYLLHVEKEMFLVLGDYNMKLYQIPGIFMVIKLE